MNEYRSVANRSTGRRIGVGAVVLGAGMLAALGAFASGPADGAPKVGPAASKVTPTKSAGLVASARGVGSGVPLQINHQGVVQVGGVRFNGTGLFRFTIVDPDTGVYLWSNDESVLATPDVPITAVSVTVTNGVYSVALGDASLTNMTTISSTVFNTNNLVLRIWFDDGPGGFSIEQLTPDHALGTAPYTFRAAKATDADSVGGIQATDLIATQPPIGSIIAWHKNLAGVPALPTGWLECNGPLADDPTTPVDESQLPNLNGEARFLRGTTGTSGFEQPDASQGHKHDVSTGFGSELLGPVSTPPAVVTWGSLTMSRNQTENNRYRAQSPISDGINGTPRTDNETRPINMSVVWIMRVK